MNQIELFFEDETSVKVEAPLCVRCKHLPCPCCTDWCDTLLQTEDDTDLCCDGECSYEPGAIEDFRARLSTAIQGRKWVRAESPA